jgi:small subunit ribosomal protein S8
MFMPAKNVLANLFSTIHNNEIRKKKECLVIPASKLASEVLKTMQKYKYIGEFEYIDDGLSGKLRIQLLGRVNKCGVVSPRFAVKKDRYSDWERRFLPAIGSGILIVSTPKGVMSHIEALNLGLGGRLIGYVY